MMDRMDEEAALRRYADALADAIETAVPGWVRRVVEERLNQALGQADPEVVARATTAGVRAGRDVGGQVRRLLEADIDTQRTTPLALLRTAVRYPTEVLRDAGVPEVVRDEFAVRSFPEDVYDLTPASFADVDEALHEPGLEWGAAKAHVHLRRRRAPRAVTIAAFVPDLMDRSRLTAVAGDRVTFVATAAALTEAEAATVVVDLSRPGVLDVIPRLSGRVIGFGSHVDRDLLAAARAAGCSEVLARSAFFGDLARWLS